MKSQISFTLLSSLVLHDIVAFTPRNFYSCSKKFRTKLHYKDNDRARYEKELEDMMGDDWRTFRAKLVAQEQAEVTVSGDRSSNGWVGWDDTISQLVSSKMKENKHLKSQEQEQEYQYQEYLHQENQYQDQYEQEKLQYYQETKHQQNVDFHQRFVEPLTADNAFNHRFSSNGRSAWLREEGTRTNKRQDKIVPLNADNAFGNNCYSFRRNTLSVHERDQYSRSQRQEYFEGDYSSTLFEASIIDDREMIEKRSMGEPWDLSNQDSFKPFDDNMDEDPFASSEELESAKKPVVSLDNRWAHALSCIEPGCVLLANEDLNGLFAQTVILIVSHYENSGTIGLIINRPLQDNFSKTVDDTGAYVDEKIKNAFDVSPAAYGGPDMEAQFSLLHEFGEVKGSKKVAPGIFVGGSRPLIEEIEKDNFDPQNTLFLKGHVAWGPDILEEEIFNGLWYVASASNDFIFRHARPEDNGANNNDESSNMWSDIMQCMGGHYAEIGEKYRRGRPAPGH